MQLLHLYTIIHFMSSLWIVFSADCWNYPTIRSKKQHEKFVSDCAGQKKLGFKDDGPSVFKASFVSESEFNKLFGRAEEIRLSIYMQNTNFVKPSLEQLQKVHVREGVPSFRIENNANLVDLKTPKQPIKAMPNGSVVSVYYFANGRGKDRHANGKEPFAEIRKLCPVKSGCHIYKDTECSRIDKEITDFNKFADKCANQSVIKGAPGFKLKIDLASFTSQQVLALFSKAEQLFGCFRSVGTYHRKIKFPRLRHIEACDEGETALLLENNPFLEEVIFPCHFTSDKSLRIRGNHILNARNIMAMWTACLQCDLQDPGEDRIKIDNDIKEVCESFPTPKNKKDYVRLVNTCSGAKKLLFNTKALECFDASYLPQFMFEELFRKVEEINFAINIKRTKYTRIYLPNLKMFNISENGMVLEVEGNAAMEHLIAHYDMQVPPDVQGTAKLAKNPVLSKSFWQRWNRTVCKYFDCQYE
ncbi:unnamed protein product [Cylicocyclus nassatus]|uniref:Uncharacterized protein n=1 Tax=Cylicocyclus nassatus TaxID=53992 RepID=A0AA36GY25_CYLNA|nr:unnamed protein product [Cylicocyclus nassatus]